MQGRGGDSLTRSTVRGMRWSALESFGAAGINFVVTLVIARLLSPEQFGVMAMLQIFLLLAQTLVDSGLSAALIRKTDSTLADQSTVFYVNILIGVVCYALLFAGAPLISRFYDMAELTSVLRMTGIIVIINSLTVVQHSEYASGLRFKEISVITLCSVVISGLAGIILAARGLGVWALVWQQIVFYTCRCVGMWVKSSWRPELIFSLRSFRTLFGFGWKLLASSLIDTAYSNLYTLVVGKIFSPFQAGLYSRAYSMALFPARGTTDVVQKVSYPVLSRIKDDTATLSSGYLRLIGMSAWIVFPVMALLGAVAEPLIMIILSEKWIGAVPYFRLICVSLALYPIHSINLNVLNVVGRSDLFLRLEIVKKLIGILIIVITIFHGVEALCVGMIVMSVVSFFINTHYTSRFVGMSAVRQMRAVASSLLLSAGVWIVAWLAQLSLGDCESWLLVVCGLSAGMGFYWIVNVLLNTKEYREMRLLLKSR